MFSVTPRSGRFTTSSGFTPTTSIQLRRKLMRVEVPRALVVSAASPVDSPVPQAAVRTFTLISEDSTSPICSRAVALVAIGDQAEVGEASGTFSPTSSAGAGAGLQ